MRLLLGVFLIVAVGALANPVDTYRRDDDNNPGNCPDGSRRSSASVASQAGSMPACSAYVSTSTITTTVKSTRVTSAVVTKTSFVESEGRTTVVKTATTTLNPTTVTTTVPFTVTSTSIEATTLTLPVVTVTSTMLFKRDGDNMDGDNRDRDHPPPPPPTKCTCIVIFATVTATQLKDTTSYTTTTTTVTKGDTDTKFTTTTTTVTPVSSVTVTTTTTTNIIVITTTTVAQTTTAVTSIPSACAGDLMAPPVNLKENTISHPESTYTAIFVGFGVPAPDKISCCAMCYIHPGCYSFNFGNFNPQNIPGSYKQNICQVFVGISSGVPIADTCTAPERVEFIEYSNPGSFGAGLGDFFYGGTGPCSSGIDVGTI